MYLQNRYFLKVFFLLTGVVLITGMVIFFSLNKAVIYDGLTNLDLIPRPEKLTELYFDNSDNLPHSVSGNRVVSFVFVIHNLETSDYRYTYEVSINVNNTRYIVDKGTLLVLNNQYYAKKEQFRIKNFSENQDIVIELTNKHQSIDFWLRK